RGDRELGAGDRVAMRDFIATRYLDWQLTRRQVSSEHKDVTTPWEQESLDIPRIVEMMMFHDTAGGQGYTRLAHRYQGYLELTEHLRTGRAILVGRGRHPAMSVRHGDGPLPADAFDQRWTFYRVVFPVEMRP
ncbi:MAG TPA: hypothetical protein PLV92_24515, partial [Pirellulaceae bacterium]|nr:hypothetical protein [Pirellulaceae bacterium]